MIYLDYAATTPVEESVYQVVQKALKESFSNPSSSYQSGKKIKYLIQQARERILNQLNLSDRSLYFTSGATESNNWAIRIQAEKSKELGYGNHIVATSIEHPSVLNVLKYLETKGFEVTYLDPIDGNYEVDQFIKATTPQTSGWVCMWINNEIGTQLPVHSLGEIAPNYVKWYHVDAVQAMGYYANKFTDLQATSISISGHKIYAPKGIGALIYQPFHSNSLLVPLLWGGGQEHGLRSGTENTPYILGLDEAISHLNDEAFQQVVALEKYLLSRLEETSIQFERNGENTVPYIINLYFPQLLASQLLIQLDLEGMAVSAGSACSSGSLLASPVLKAYYPADENRYTHSIRVSIGKLTTKDEIDNFIITLEKIHERMMQNGI